MVWARIDPVRRWRAVLAAATGGDYVGVEKFLVFAVGAVAAGWLAWGTFHLGAISGEVVVVAGGWAFLTWTIRRIKSIRRRSPGFLSRGSAETPASRVRQASSLFALVLVMLLALALVLGCVGFILALAPFLIWSFTGQRWAVLYIGLPLSPLTAWALFRVLGGRPSHRDQPVRPSTPTGRGRGDPREYEVRFGWHRAMWFYQVVCWAIVAAGCVAWSDAPWITVGAALVFGGYAGWQLLGALMRAVAIRVGPAGVVLGTRPVKGEVRFTPWSEIEAVVVSEDFNGSRPTDRVGVLTRAEAAVPDITEAPPSSVAAYSWNLDMERLATAIQLNAPQVRLVDLRG